MKTYFPFVEYKSENVSTALFCTERRRRKKKKKECVSVRLLVNNIETHEEIKTILQPLERTLIAYTLIVDSFLNSVI